MQGGGDDFSDIDTILYYEQPPTEAEFETTIAAARAAGGDFYHGTAAEGFAVYTYVEGIRCDFGHGPIAAVEKMVADFLAEPDLDDVNRQIAIAGFGDGLPLHGADWVRNWQAKLAQYPPSLGPATTLSSTRPSSKRCKTSLAFCAG